MGLMAKLAVANRDLGEARVSIARLLLSVVAFVLVTIGIILLIFDFLKASLLVISIGTLMAVLTTVIAAIKSVKIILPISKKRKN
jgi:membrane-bound ClpP family serine protease